jgi:hypothetical protein
MQFGFRRNQLRGQLRTVNRSGGFQVAQTEDDKEQQPAVAIGLYGEESLAVKSSCEEPQ